MQLINKPLQVWHYPQIPCDPFKIDVKDEWEALKIGNILADHHLFLYNNNIIQDYSNAIEVVMYENGEWVSYINDEGMDWDEMGEILESSLT